MNVEQITQALREVSDADFEHIFDQMILIRQERQARPQVEAAKVDMATQLWEEHPNLKPEYQDTDPEPAETIDSLVAKIPPWKKPSGPATAYPLASLVQHQGKLWRNRTRGMNESEPGTKWSRWEDVTRDFLRPEPVHDGNAPEQESPTSEKPAPTPESEEPQNVTPAPTVAAWTPGETLIKGTTRTYKGKLYVCQRFHTTKAGLEPDAGTGYWQLLV